MRKIIIAIPNCPKCKMLKAQCPDAEVVKAEPSELLQFARLVGIQGMPFVVVTGEPQELAKDLFKETAVEISYLGITDKQGKLRTIYPTKKGAK